MRYPVLVVLTAFSFSAQAGNIDWTGCYAGLNAGYGYGNNQWTTTYYSGSAYNDNAGSAKSHGAIGGAQVGCDLQRANWVFGVQGMFDSANLEGRHHYAGGTAQDTVTYKTDEMATLTGRMGYLFSPTTLVYAKAGWAWASNTYDDNSPDAVPPVGFYKKQVRDGWIAGVGIEYSFTTKISLFAEYNRIEFGKKSIHLDQKVGSGVNDYQATVDQNMTTLLVGLNYHF